MTPVTLAGIAGAWQLERATAALPDGGIVHPFGTEPRGLLLYTADGWMSATICRGASATSPAAAGAVSAVSYAGRVAVRTDAVVHQVSVGGPPFGPGTEQVRLARFDRPDRLVLTTPGDPAREPIVELVWRRRPA